MPLFASISTSPILDWLKKAMASSAPKRARGLPAKLHAGQKFSGFAILPEVAFSLDRIPELPEPYKRASVYQVLSVMSVRPVSPGWFAKNTRLPPSENRQLLRFLHTCGALQVLDLEFAKSERPLNSLQIDKWFKGT